MTESNLFNSWLNETKPYQAGKTFEEIAREYGFTKDQILRLAGNESTIGTSPNAIKAAQESCLSSNFYAEPKSESLLKALEEDFSKDVSLDGLAFACGNGMDSMIEHCLTLFTKKGDSIINISPTFIYYAFAAERHGLEIINVDREIKSFGDTTKEYFIDLKKVISSIQENTKVIFLCSPNNPDGSVIELDQIKLIAKVCQEKNIILFVDHAYIEFTDRKRLDVREIIKNYPNMIAGYTFSKAYAMAGFRVGYALMHKVIQERFLTLLTPFLISNSSIVAAQAALKDKEHLKRVVANNNSQALLLEQELKAFGFEVYRSHANFILFKTSNKDLFERLLEKGIIIRKMLSLGALRITVGTADENQRVIKAIKEINS
jgi:histidinol-phosphate aminotransferase